MKKVNKKALLTALAFTVSTVAQANAADESLFNLSEVDSNSLIACNEGNCGEGKCGEAFCASKKTKKLLKRAGVKKKMNKEAKCGEGKCGEGICGTKKIKNLIDRAG